MSHLIRYTLHHTCLNFSCQPHVSIKRCQTACPAFHLCFALQWATGSTSRPILTKPGKPYGPANHRMGAINGTSSILSVDAQPRARPCIPPRERRKLRLHEGENPQEEGKSRKGCRRIRDVRLILRSAVPARLRLSACATAVSSLQTSFDRRVFLAHLNRTAQYVAKGPSVIATANKNKHLPSDSHPNRKGAHDCNSRPSYESKEGSAW